MVSPAESEQISHLPPLPARLGDDVVAPSERLAELRDLPRRYGSLEVAAITYIGQQALEEGNLFQALEAKSLLQRPDAGWRQRVANRQLGSRISRAYWEAIRSHKQLSDTLQTS